MRPPACGVGRGASDIHSHPSLRGLPVVLALQFDENYHLIIDKTCGSLPFFQRNRAVRTALVTIKTLTLLVDGSIGNKKKVGRFGS